MPNEVPAQSVRQDVITDSTSFLDAVMHGNRLLRIRFLHIQTPGRFAVNRKAIQGFNLRRNFPSAFCFGQKLCI